MPDHLPVFYTVSKRLPLRQTKYFRDFSRFNKDLLLSDLEAINFSNLVDEDVNQSINNIINAIQSLSDKHAPMRKIIKQKKQSAKPWISNAILKSMRRRHRLFKTNFLSNDPNKVPYYKAYNNKLNRIKNVFSKTI